MNSNVNSRTLNFTNGFTNASYYFMIYVLTVGNSYQSLEYQHRIGHTTIEKIIPYTCSAIYLALKDIHKGVELGCL